MLDRIHLRDFKCFEQLTLPLPNLTLLTGFNASGKSTALQPMLLMSQALRGGSQSTSIALNGSLVRLGTPSEVFNEFPSGGSRNLLIGVGSGPSDAWWRLGAEDRNIGSALTLEEVKLTGAPGGDLTTNGWPNPAAVPDQHKMLLECVREVVFLSAVRTGTPETYPSIDETNPIQADVGVEGQYATWWFQRHLDDDIAPARRHPGEAAPTLRRQFNAWASELFPGIDANAQRIARTSQLRLELRTRTTEDYRRPANIGYGLTYVFPVLVALLLAKDGQTIVVDSPEAHLHPSGQSALGRILAAFSAVGVQIVVETHSDHLLNGVRRAASSGIVQARDVGIHFFRSIQGKTEEARVTTIAVDGSGSLDNWPSGFFDQADIDLASLAGWVDQ
ncbi:AAA family ATPase [Pinisolibacter aquiterrae]|uniref:AAA family ATPase n=1 Tax=Pinisolibacter aquiterrae TaxID=2815579 RepID=UPI001C3DB315|nr:DUF3696 domain-containing protein [Pinisolibacter aquiterrae]MBV5262899.1 DUF3696 domain-containing protein [Pinisolibacter aquiterrae]MCC8235746.1 DUF3696 domain-containing protein [Pinisolibacter aquiterrae]